MTPISPVLTAAEERVLALVAEGLSDAEIGSRLAISEGTVGTHLRNAYRKLQVGRRMDAVRVAGLLVRA